MEKIPEIVRKIAIFVGGAVVGALIAKKYYKDMYENLSDEVEMELSEARAYVKQFEESLIVSGIKEGLESSEDDEFVKAARRVVENAKYGIFDPDEKPPLSEVVSDKTDLRVIEEDEFDELVTDYTYGMLVYIKDTGHIYNHDTSNPIDLRSAFGELFEKEFVKILSENMDSERFFMASSRLKHVWTVVMDSEEEDEEIEVHNIFDEYGEEDEEEDEYDEQDSDD